MSAPDLDDPAQRRAYVRELRGVGRPLRLAALAITLVGVFLAVAARMGRLPEWIPLLVILTGGAFMVAAVVQRTQYHRRRMRGE
ncbi:hypothetical protein [Stakelama saccharophila]|uniref:Uncharacterized protein n=1 Tax=Stakelama saccharophila TaxID=3075605 RepID=A0ABZ0BBU0_9SPHN|nr:hypothetical protein [Stakelama sp. W311]WNO54754.1 hypothetical protein RPR59_05770 [Stakelama sp. W311]